MNNRELGQVLVLTVYIWFCVENPYQLRLAEANLCVVLALCLFHIYRFLTDDNYHVDARKDA